MRSKLQVFLMLPVLFMATIPSLYDPLTKLAHGVVLLIGRVISERFRRDKGHRTCFNHVFQDDIKLSKLHITEGLSEFAQATPRALINHICTILCTTQHALICWDRCLVNGCSEMREETRYTHFMI